MYAYSKHVHVSHKLSSANLPPSKIVVTRLIQASYELKNGVICPVFPIVLPDFLAKNERRKFNEHDSVT
jgi:hypothetical protein